MRKKLFIFSFGALSLLSFNSCKKEGCIDSIASNYDADADKDDGSCTYEASVQFWYDQSTSQALQALDIISLRFYVDNQIIGSSDAGVYFNADPACGQNAVVRKTMDLGKLKSKTVSYKVIDDVDDEIWSGTVTFDANVACTSTKLTY